MTESNDESNGPEIPTIPEWSTYSRDPIFSNLSDINLFDLIIYLPKIFNLSNREITRALGDRIYEEVAQALAGAGFYGLEFVRRIQGESRTGVIYDDDELGFECYVDADGDLRLLRTGSSFERFHSWYSRFMPSVDSLVSRILTGMRSLIPMGYAANQGSGGGSEFAQRLAIAPAEIRPVRASYNFRFVAYDFTQPPSEEIQRNFVVMRSLLGNMPGVDGRLSQDLHHEPTLEEAAKYGRLDYKVSLWTGDTGSWARNVYNVEAPGNRRFSTVWFSFSYIGETKIEPDGTRLPFEFTPFLKNYEIPYVSFLQQAALEGFLRDLTRGMVFRTTSGLLP